MTNENKRSLLQGLWLANLGFICFSWLASHWSSLASGDLGLILVCFGSLFGLVATYLFLTQFLLISGTKFIEARWGLDRLAGNHSYNGKVAFGLLLVHPFLINAGRSLMFGEGGFVEDYIEFYFELVQNNWRVALAGLALTLFFVIIFTSIFIVRKHLKYEYWHFVHLATYIAVLLPAFHQFQLGKTLNGSEWFKIYWFVLYAFCFGAIAYFKWIRPLQLYLKHRFVVDELVPEANGIVSIYISGKNLKEFKYKAGQFALWRFITSGLKFQRHPFTISASPGDERLRITVKNIGDGSGEIQKIRPGTPVVVDGPYGRFTNAVETKKHRLFIAGGIGITPIASMLKDSSSKNDTLIYAVRNTEDLALRKELTQTKANVIEVFSEQKDSVHSGRVDETFLKNHVKLLEQHDVWLCGPPPMMNAVEKSLLKLGVPQKQIHTERFRL